MSTTLRTILYVLLFALIIPLGYNLDSDESATRHLKNGLELAIHDASLSIDVLSLAAGKIIFQDGNELPSGRILDNNALENFKQSLEKNLNLTSSNGLNYIPVENTFFKDNIEIVHLEFIDDRNPELRSLIKEFGYYPYYNEKYEIVDKLYGPAIIVIASTKSPRWFKGEGIPIYQGAIYEYKSTIFNY